MTYRSENTGIEMRRIMHEEAKATLEDLAGMEYIDLPHVESSLQTMGFQKEAEIRAHHIGPIIMYSRETAKGIELLVDRDLAKLDGKIPHLYHIPAGQDVEEWIEKIPLYEKKNDLTAKSLAIGGGFLAVLAGFANLINSPLPQKPEDGFAYAFACMVGGLLTGTGMYELLTRRSPLHNQTIAKGSDALHYIADTKYDPPKLRVEARAETKPRIIDAEFTDEPAELEVLAVEQPADVRRRLTKEQY